MPRAPVVAVTHGGGPMPILNEPGHKELIHSMSTRIPALLKLDTPNAPRAIVVVTAHRSEAVPVVSNGSKHSLYYDYYGFPKEAYEVKYPAPGSPEIALEVAAALRAQGLKPMLDDVRGWDHGVFVPMSLINPKANVPVVQLSVLESEDPAEHFAMGRALETLRDGNVAIVGSGSPSSHNFKAMRGGLEYYGRQKEWLKVLNDAVGEEDPEVRERKLIGWRSFPHTYDMHPQGGGDHFMPLLVCAGAGGRGKAGYFTDKLFGLDQGCYYWD